MQPYVGQNYPGGSSGPSSGFGAVSTMPNNAQMAPAAQRMSQMGRNGDSMLMHMAPEEVRGLQQLAIAHGGSLTINPETGLYEASFLKNLLPMILGAALTATGVGAPLAALMVGGGYGLAKGSLKEGLMAGLQAFGGAGIGGALKAGISGLASAGASSAIPAAAAAAAPAATGTAAANILSAAPAAAGITNVGTLGANAARIGASGLSNTINAASLGGTSLAAPTLASGFLPAAGNAASIGGLAPIVPGYAPTAGQMLKNAAYDFTNTVTQNPFATAAQKAAGQTTLTGLPATLAKGAATSGALSGLSAALTPDAPNFEGLNKTNMPYTPYEMAPRSVSYPTSGDYSAEHSYFSPAVFRPKRKLTPEEEYAKMFDIDRGYAAGGVSLKDGSFVVDARTVSELGNGSSRAGQDILARHGGQPIRGRGDGVSDSVRANIGGVQEARVARDEVKFDPEAVRRMGSGNSKQGARKLYALMDRAKQARKHADRGEDTKLRGLMAAR